MYKDKNGRKRKSSDRLRKMVTKNKLFLLIIEELKISTEFVQNAIKTRVF